MWRLNRNAWSHEADASLFRLRRSGGESKPQLLEEDRQSECALKSNASPGESWLGRTALRCEAPCGRAVLPRIQ